MSLMAPLSHSLRRLIKGIRVPELPHMEPAGLSYFENELSRCTFYLEYGSGGSTVMAAKLGKEFISVENSRLYGNAVRRKVGPASKGTLIYADTGLTGDWGIPVFKRLSKRRAARWRSYAQAPWDLILGGSRRPDLVLVDGRFRVASALTCVKYLAGTPAKILVDDYTDRPHYREIEMFADLKETRGRIAVFMPKPFEAGKLDGRIFFYGTDWR